MAQFTAFGKTVKKKLVDIDQTQNWLIERIKNMTGLYMDSFYLHKILTGQRSAHKIVTAICEILDLAEQHSENTQGGTQ